jgi:hypothetical protein
MPGFNVAKAVRSNPIYASHLRWLGRYSAVVAALGIDPSPDSAVAFAEGVAAWQERQRPRLKPDGMLGPVTWRRLRPQLRSGASPVPAPAWLTTTPESEGWTDAIVATLRQDTTFIDVSHGVHRIRHRDFLLIADLIEAGHIDVFAVRNRRAASYEFRNAEADANSIDVPRRARSSWRKTQALLVHEACHAISDYRGLSTAAVDEEAMAYVVQSMYHQHHHIPSSGDRSRHTRAIRDAASSLAQDYLDGRSPDDSDWEALREAILEHPVYRERARASLVFDGIPVATE